MSGPAENRVAGFEVGVAVPSDATPALIASKDRSVVAAGMRGLVAAGTAAPTPIHLT